MPSHAVARGLFHPVERAWVAAMVLLLCGAVFSIAKGLDWEEASILCLFALSLWGFRDSFYRRPIAGPFELSWNWIATVGTTVLVSTWLGFFVYRHIEYSSDLWWDFAWNGNAPRFLRATVLVFAVVAAVGLHSIINRHGQRRRKVDHSIPDAVPALVARCPHTDAAPCHAGRQAISAGARRQRVHHVCAVGRSLIALDASLSAMPKRARNLPGLSIRLPTVWRCALSSMVSARKACRFFLDMGLIALKLGEVARVDLTDFSLEGPRRQPFRLCRPQGGQGWADLRDYPCCGRAPLIPRLRAISDAWLDHKSGSEKGFSLGYFNDEYLKAFRYCRAEERRRNRCFRQYMARCRQV
ncbi:phosphatidylglycerol lysyltransferase domain-containing protein [Brucella abortus]|nr:phosphatidylglycerol lysyltransferase domain-containing protein [Brucella abortus]